MNTTSRQLQDMMRDHLKQGRDCIYLCMSAVQCKHAFGLMVNNYQYIEASSNMGFIRFPQGQRVLFRSVQEGYQRLYGLKGYILYDHAAFSQSYDRDKVRDFLDYINHVNDRLDP